MRFGRHCLSRSLGIASASENKVRDGRRLQPAGDWVRRSTLYASLVRSTTAWDHDHDGHLASRPINELGTFLKTILLLPHLRRIGANALYLLPIVDVSRAYRKGDLGCPYATRNFFKLDADLHDPLLGGRNDSIENQFALLIECAHRLNIRVIVDVAPRTSARDCDWILEHPEWFYWIDRRFERSFRAPRLPGIDYSNARPGRLGDIYAAAEVKQHLRKFRFGPQVINPRRWERFVARRRERRPEYLMREIAEGFGVVTAPGFSDVINDKQAAWTDVTYLRLFADHSPEARQHLEDPDKQPPYVLFDTAKAGLFPGTRPHRKLWKKLSDIIPFYQRFGVDGARIDMAHALPTDLERTILDRPRRIDPDFCFLAENLVIEGHAAARKAGYNAIVGPCWSAHPRAGAGRMRDLAAELPKLRLPVLAASEMPDTPRAAVRQGGRAFSRLTAVMNAFLPNAVPFINAGQELFERQPMNLGLDVVPPGRNALPKTDPQAGKLAFFDRYALHWQNRGADKMIALLQEVHALRCRLLEVLVDSRRAFVPQLIGTASDVFVVAYRLRPRSAGVLLLLANYDMNHPARAKITLPAPANQSRQECETLLEICRASRPQLIRGRVHATLPPADAKLVLVRPRTGGGEG